MPCNLIDLLKKDINLIKELLVKRKKYIETESCCLNAEKTCSSEISVM